MLQGWAHVWIMLVLATYASTVIVKVPIFKTELESFLEAVVRF